MEHLTLNTPQQVIMDCVRNLPDPLPRSTVAKLLAGSRSTRVAGMEDSVFFGRLSQLRRKSILHYIDTLVQQGFLDTDGHGNLIYASARRER